MKISNYLILFTVLLWITPILAQQISGRILDESGSWQLEEAGNHFGNFPGKFKVYTKIMSDSGWAVGYTSKGWGPGRWGGVFGATPLDPILITSIIF